MLSFGDARPFAAAIKDAGQVQTVAQAMEAIDMGSDIVVAQGTEAGGHGATRSTLALVPAVVDAVRERNDEIVVVAAGGIADGRGLAAALMLGAQGALRGSRPTYPCPQHPRRQVEHLLREMSGRPQLCELSSEQQEGGAWRARLACRRERNWSLSHRRLMGSRSVIVVTVAQR
jgi:hypothetical protein